MAPGSCFSSNPGARTPHARAPAFASSRQRRRASFLRSRAHVVPMHRMQRLPAEWDFRWSSLGRAGGVLAERLAPNPKGGLCAASACSGQGECCHCRGGGVLATSAVAGCGLRWIDGVAGISRVMVLAAPRTIAPVDPTAIKQRVGGVFPNVRRPGWTATALPSRSSGSRTCASCCACAVARIARGPAMPDLPAERRGSGLLLQPGKEIRVSGPAARVWPCDGRLAVRRERRRGVRR